MRQEILFLFLAIFFLGVTTHADSDCVPSKAAMDFQEASENFYPDSDHAQAALRAAWEKVNKNNDGQTNLLNGCAGDIVGRALATHHYGVADILMSSDYNFSPSDYDPHGAKGRQTAMQLAGEQCNAEQILTLRLFGVPDSEAKKEQRRVQDSIIYFSPRDGKVHKDEDGDVINPLGTHPVDWGAFSDQIHHRPHVLTREQKEKRVETDKEGLARNKDHAGRCRSALWALSVPLDKLTSDDLTKYPDRTSRDKSSLHALLVEQGLPDWPDGQCLLKFSLGACNSPVQNVMAAVKHVQLRAKKLPDPAQLNIYVPRGTDIPDSVSVTPVISRSQ